MATKKKKKKVKKSQIPMETSKEETSVVEVSETQLEEDSSQEKQQLKARSTRKVVLKTFVVTESGTNSVYISQVTEKTIKVIMGERGCCYFSRFTGMAQGEASFKLYGKSQLQRLPSLEDFLRLHGKEEDKADKSGITHTWRSLWRPRYNSRGEVVNYNTECLQGRSIESWLCSMGFSIIVL